MAGTFRIRIGHEADFLVGAKQYFGAFEKANIDECTLGYQVVAGAPCAGTGITSGAELPELAQS